MKSCQKWIHSQTISNYKLSLLDCIKMWTTLMFFTTEYKYSTIWISIFNLSLYIHKYNYKIFLNIHIEYIYIHIENEVIKIIYEIYEYTT